MEESAEMKRVVNFSAMAAWKEWSAEMKFDLWSHPQAEELLVRATDPLKILTQHPTMETRNYNALLDTRP